MENYTTIKKWTILTTFLKFIKTNAKKQKTKKTGMKFMQKALTRKILKWTLMTVVKGEHSHNYTFQPCA